MRRSVVASLFLTLAAMFPAGGAGLGEPRLAVPPRFGTLTYDILDAGSYDGQRFLVTLNTRPMDAAGAKAILLIDSDGRQLSDPVAVPREMNAIGFTGNVYVFVFTYPFAPGFLRVSADGELLDDALVPLPVPAEAAAGGSRLFLVKGKGQLHLVDPHGAATPAGAVNGAFTGIAAKGDRFAVSSFLDNKYQLRILDERGSVLLEKAMPEGAWSVRSDGASWMFIPRSASLPWKIVDDDLNTLRSVTTTVQLDPNVGRGYIGLRDQYPSFPNPAPPAQALEVTGPPYDVKGAPLPGKKLGNSALRGNANTLLFIERSKGYPQTAHLVSSLGDLNRPLPPALSFTGAFDREAVVVATNAEGVSLLVWHEPVSQEKSSTYAARVSPSGAPIDASPVLLAEDCRTSRSAVATDGTDFFVVSSGCSEAAGHLFAANGTVTRSFTVRKDQAYRNDPAAVFDGEAYLVAWPDLHSTFLTRVERNGTAVIPAATKLNYGSGLRMAPLAGGGAMMVYNDETGPRLVSRVLTRAAQLEDGQSPIRTIFVEADSLTREGDRFLLTGRAYGDPFLMRLDDRGKPDTKQAHGILLESASSRVFCDAECVLVWKDEVTKTGMLAATIRSSADGIVLAEPVTLEPPGAIFGAGDPVLLRGTPADPRLLLFTASHPTTGSMQIFARSSAGKRRASRP